MKNCLKYVLILIFLNTVPGRSQNLNFYLTSDSVVYCFSNQIPFYASGQIQNLSTSDTLTIDVIRVDNNMPTHWSSGICTDICYPIYTDSTAFQLPPGESQLSKMGFRNMFPNPDTAHVKLLIRDQQNQGNYFIQNFYGIDTLTGTVGVISHKQNFNLNVFPNPFLSETTIQFPDDLQNGTMTIYNSLGQTKYF